MDIHECIDHLRNGYTMSRREWLSKGTSVRLVEPTKDSLFDTPVLILTTGPQRRRYPYLINGEDMEAVDWYCLDVTKNMKGKHESARQPTTEALVGRD